LSEKLAKTMAKKQGRERQELLRGFGAAPLAGNLSKAEALMRKGEWGQARELLNALDTQHPNNEEVLRLMAALNYQIQDFTRYQVVCRRLHALKPNDAGLLLALGGAYMTGGRTVLALQAFRQFLERSPDHPKAADIRDVVPKLEETSALLVAEIAAKAGGEGADLEAAALHELTQLHMLAGELAEGRATSEALLQKCPSYLPARNNLSLIWALEGRWNEAIAAAQQVLELDPENAHALSNLTRFHYLSGQPDAAQTYKARLQAMTSEQSDVWQKQAEAFSFVGDFPAILEVFRHAETVAAASETKIPPLLYHLAAVAELRSGHERQAKQYWQAAIAINPAFELAQENLADLQGSIAERQSPWAFPLNYWISPQAMDDVLPLEESAKTGTEADLRVATQHYLQRHPEVEAVIPMLLDRADGAGRQLALNLALMTDTPAMHQILKDFALGQRGADDMRQQAAQVAARAGMFPEGRVRLWIAGQWQEVMLRGYEIHHELLHHHAPEVERLTSRAVMALRENEWAKAEHPLKQALKMEPNALDLGYNLAIVYERQGKTDEAFDLLDQLHQQDPDYVFARIGVARSYLKQGKLAEVATLLQPLEERQRFHYSEFGAFCDIKMELLVARKDYEAAREWLTMWRVVAGLDKGHDYWQDLLASDNPHRQLARARAWDWKEGDA
jgi:tetratricopeptide (TPR) repeat protein